MKNYLRILSILFIVGMSLNGIAQVTGGGKAVKQKSSGNSSVSFGLKVGLNLANMLLKDDEETYSDELKMKPGYLLGITLERSYSDMFSFETGLLFANKGYKIKEDGEKLTLSLMYLDIPLNLKAYYDLGGVKIFGVFGPYIGIGISGKAKWEEDGDSDTETVEWGSDSEDSDFKRLDFGLKFGAGAEISKFQVGLNYNFGLANISTYTEDGFKAKNRVLAITFGYKF